MLSLASVLPVLALSLPTIQERPTRLVDLNADGRPDRLRLAAGEVTLDWNRGRRLFERAGLPATAEIQRLEVLDLDLDGTPDLLLAGPAGLVGLVGDRAEGFVERTAELGLAFPGAVLALDVMDLDGDQRPDLLVQGLTGDVVLWGRGGGGFDRDGELFADDRAALAPEPRVLVMPGEAVAEPSAIEERRSASDRPGSLRVPATAPSAGPATAAVTGGAGPACLDSLEDSSTGNCLLADSTPTLGRLYPLGPEFFIDPTGQVGVGTLSPSSRLTVAGVVESASGGFRFPDGSLQTTAVAPGGTAVPSGSLVLWDGGTPPAGYSSTGLAVRLDGPEGWALLPASSSPGTLPSASGLNGKIWVFGFSTSEAFDVVTQSWATVSAPAVARHQAVTGVLGNEIFLVGGTAQVAEAYDTTTDTWRTLAVPPSRHAEGGGAFVNGKLYAFGGTVQTDQSIYDPVLDSWTVGASMPVGFREGASAVLGSTVYLVGGRHGGNFNGTVRTYEVTTGTWAQAPSLPVSTRFGSATVIDGALIYMGGLDTAGAPRSEVFRYIPEAGLWAELPSLPAPRYQTSATTLEGAGYLTGGNLAGRFERLSLLPTVELVRKD